MRLCALFIYLIALCGPAWAQAPNAVDAAVGPYRVFNTDVQWLDSTEIGSAAALDEALDRAARHAPGDIARGWIAYGAMSALTSHEFRDGVLARVRAASRAAVLRRLNVDITYARRRPRGADEAIGAILRVSIAVNSRLDDAAGRFDSLGGSLRLAPWAATPQADHAARDAHLHALLAPPAPTNFVIAIPTTPPSPRVRPDRMAVIDRMLTLAALRILEATTAQRARTDALLSNDATARCLTLARLELRQCVSVTQFPYEDSFCIARHGLRDPAQCLSLAAP